MNTNSSAKYEAREAFVNSIAKKHRALATGMTTEVELTWGGEPYLRFRIFKADGEWLTIKHRASTNRALKDIAGLEYETQGERENRTETRDAALGWIALHWQDVVEKMMEARS